MTLPDGYTELKAAHVAAALAFTGGVLVTAVFLPALKATSLAAEPESRTALRWSRTVTTPAMLLVWAFGLALGIEGRWFAQPWLQAKLVLVLILSALHGMQSGVLRRRAGGMAPHVASPQVAGLALACIAVIAALAVAKLA